MGKVFNLGFVLESDLKHFVFPSHRRTSDIAWGFNCKNYRYNLNTKLSFREFEKLKEDQKTKKIKANKKAKAIEDVKIQIGVMEELDGHFKVSATLQDRPCADRCNVSCFYTKPYKPYIF